MDTLLPIVVNFDVPFSTGLLLHFELYEVMQHSYFKAPSYHIYQMDFIVLRKVTKRININSQWS